MMELREAVISAVCARNFDLLPGLVQKLARLSPTEDVLRGSGIGHLVGDTHIWGLVGHTTQRRAEGHRAREAPDLHLRSFGEWDVPVLAGTPTAVVASAPHR